MALITSQPRSLALHNLGFHHRPLPYLSPSFITAFSMLSWNDGDDTSCGSNNILSDLNSCQTKVIS
jgi:hypothetical protein